MDKITNLLLNRNSFSTFTANLREISKEENQDIRTLGHEKAMHLVAKSLGYKNWHELKSIIDKSEFMHTMNTIYGFGEPYADAAWLSLHSSVIDGNRSPKQAALDYCKQYHISPQPLWKMNKIENFGEMIQSLLIAQNPQELIDEVNLQLNDLIIDLHGDNDYAKSRIKDSFESKINMLHSTKNLDDVITLVEHSFPDINLTKELKDIIMSL